MTTNRNPASATSAHDSVHITRRYLEREAGMAYTKRFDEIGRDDLSLAGGKGANLGELSRAGLPVPPGFVVTTGAYDDFVEAGGLRDEILAPRVAGGRSRRAGGSGGGDPRCTSPESGFRRSWPRRSGSPTESWPKTARPSPPAPPRPPRTCRERASPASRRRYLNVRGEAALLEAVKDCWASLWTARAMAYRARQGIDPASVSLAVVVQRMVEAEAAGILFTADPVSGRRNRVVISAVWGLGESVVGGRVSPDTLIVDKLERALDFPRDRRQSGDDRLHEGRDRGEVCAGSASPGAGARRRRGGGTGAIRGADRGTVRSAAGRRVGSGRWQVLYPAGAPDHGAARADPNRLGRAEPEGLLLARQYRGAPA